MATIVTREVGGTAKGSPLTNAEVDNNFINLNTDLVSARTEIFHSRPNIRPSLNIDFSNSETFDRRLTFTRGSNAVLVNKLGYFEKVPQDTPRITYEPLTKGCQGLLIEEQRANLVDSEIQNWTATSCFRNLTRDTLDPFGGFRAVKVQRGATATYQTLSRSFTTTNGGTYSFSFFGKQGEAAGYFFLQFHDGIWKNVSFDLNTIGASASTGTARIEDVGNGWYRCCWEGVVINTASLSFTYHPFTAGSTAGDPTTYQYMFGMQIEAGSMCTSYIAPTVSFSSRTSSATYFDKDGVMRVAGQNQARENFAFDVKSGKWLSAGLLEESGATNNISYHIPSISPGGWQVAGSATLTPNLQTAPDGTLTMTAFGQPNATGAFAAYKGFTSVAGYVYTSSVYVRGGNGISWVCLHDGSSGAGKYFNIATGAVGQTVGNLISYSIEKVGTYWWRISITYTENDTLGYFQLDHASADGVRTGIVGSTSNYIYIWGAQVETAGTLSSLVPTNGAAVSRVADTCSWAASTRAADTPYMDVGDWFNPREGTIFSEQYHSSTTNYPIFTAFNQSSGTSGEIVTYTTTGSGETMFIRNTSVQANIFATGGLKANNTFFKFAGAYSDNYAAASLDGSAALTDTSVSLPNSLVRLRLGYYNNQYWLNGCMKKMSYYPKKVSESELQALTK